MWPFIGGRTILQHKLTEEEEDHHCIQQLNFLTSKGRILGPQLLESGQNSLASLLPGFTNPSMAGLIGTCFSSKGVTILSELRFVYKVAAPAKALIKGASLEQELTSNFVTVNQPGQGLLRLVQEPPPPPLTDSEVSDDEDRGEEEDGEEMQFFQMDNFLAGIHGVEGLLGHHQGPGGN